MALGHGHGVAVVVDNTFASPALLRPTEFGADLVVHSATKYLSGHGRVLAGTVAGRVEQIEEIREMRRRIGTGAKPPRDNMVRSLTAAVSVPRQRRRRNSLFTAESKYRELAVRPSKRGISVRAHQPHPGLPARATAPPGRHIKETRHAL